MRVLRPLVVVVVASALSVSGCGSDDPPDQLLNNPMSRPVIEFAVETGHITTAGSDGFIQGSPARSVTRYDVSHDDRAEAADDILAQAEAAGWTLTPSASTAAGDGSRGLWTGSLSVDGANLRLSISVSDRKVLPDASSDLSTSTITVDLQA